MATRVSAPRAGRFLIFPKRAWNRKHCRNLQNPKRFRGEKGTRRKIMNLVDGPGRRRGNVSALIFGEMCFGLFKRRRWSMDGPNFRGPFVPIFFLEASFDAPLNYFDNENVFINSKRVRTLERDKINLFFNGIYEPVCS